MKQYCPTVTTSTADVTYQIEMYPLMAASLDGLERWEAKHGLGEQPSLPVRLWRWFFRRRVRALRGEDYPALAKIWDNEEDDIFDDL